MKSAKKTKTPVFTNYVPPPLSLLNSEMGKPTTGDLLANANIIKRTLDELRHPGGDGRDQRRPCRHALHPEAGGGR